MSRKTRKIGVQKTHTLWDVLKKQKSIIIGCILQ